MVNLNIFRVSIFIGISISSRHLFFLTDMFRFSFFRFYIKLKRPDCMIPCSGLRAFNLYKCINIRVSMIRTSDIKNSVKAYGKTVRNTLINKV